jgi:mannosyltransferase
MTPSATGRTWPVPAACALVMLLVGLWGLDRGSMWQDEAATFEVAHRSVAEILAMLRKVDVVHGLYYLFMHVWLLPGGGEVWMRVPSVLGMAVAAGAVAALGVLLAGRGVGLVAGLLFCAAPLTSFYAQEGRSTALVTAAVLLASVLLVVLADAGASPPRSRRRGGLLWAGYAVVMAVAVVLHEFAVLALAAHAVTLLLNRARVGTWLRWLGVAAGCAVLVLPLALASKSQSGQVSWLTRPDGQTLLQLGGELFGTNAVLLLLTVPLVVVGVVSDVRQRRTAGWTVSSVALPLLLVPLVLLLGASLVQPLFHIRYVLFVVAGVPLVAARGLLALAGAAGRVTARPVIAVAVVAVVVVALAAAQLPQQAEVRTVASRNNDLAAAARVVAEGSRPGDAVIFLPLRYRAAALAYPQDFTKVDDIALATSGVEADNLRGTDKSRRQVRKAMLARERIWVVGRSGLTVRKAEKGALAAQAVLKADFTKTTTVSMHGMQVALFVRKPAA